jgi:gliding motility-associated-like protein
VGTVSEVLVSGGTLPYTINFDATLLALNPDYSITAIMPGTTNFTVVDACNQTVQTSILSYVCNTVIPDIFTPNGDDLNETFTITGIEFFPGSSVLIFDRWGGLVHESADYKNDWNGGDAPDGVYYYIFNRSDGESFAGYVHLAR